MWRSDSNFYGLPIEKLDRPIDRLCVTDEQFTAFVDEKIGVSMGNLQGILAGQREPFHAEREFLYNPRGDILFDLKEASIFD